MLTASDARNNFFEHRGYRALDQLLLTDALGEQLGGLLLLALLLDEVLGQGAVVLGLGA
jgi:hypothetical protein